MGKPIQSYPGRKAGRRLTLAFAALFALAGLGILTYILWQVGLKQMDFGLAVVAKSLLWPGLLACALLFTAVALGMAAIRKELKSLVIFQDGFALRGRGRVHTWRWENIHAITSRITRHYLFGIYSGTRHHYVLRGVDNSEMILDDSIRHVEQAARFILQETFQNRFEKAVEQIESGNSVAFGPMQLSNAGVRVGEVDYPWSDLEGAEMRNGKLTISGKAKISLQVEAVPNLDVLVTLLLQNVQKA